ncbi:MAG: DeoR/GlpR transcriptional regulator [Lachnospiraceae bacterium]|nr:DeoR/GlpR transcriptional regulator [Lachnospiraceae bacterium]
MLAEERKEQILELLKKEHIIKVAELSRQFHATEATIRRDLDILQSQGKIRRIHGGAVLAKKANRDFNYSELSILCIEEKKRIAAKALEYIQSGDSLLFDGSTTGLELGKLLLKSSFKDISIITNSFHLVSLFTTSSIRVIHTGGELFSGMNYAAGTIAEQMLSGIRVDKCFLGANGIEPSYGYSVPNFLDSSLKKSMRLASRLTFILADHTKFGDSYMAKFANFSGEIDYLITDRLPENTAEKWDTSTKIITADLL